MSNQYFNSSDDLLVISKILKLFKETDSVYLKPRGVLRILRWSPKEEINSSEQNV